MNFEKIEQAYHLILENIQLIENDLKTNIYDALIEQNSFYLGAEGATQTVTENNKRLKALHLTAEEWRRAFQFIFIKAGQTEALQANHQFTPDAIGFILLFLLETLTHKEELTVIEIGSGTGNLAHTLVNNSSKTLDYMGLELDDLLIDLSASIADILASSISFVQEDAVRPQILKESDVIISDLPIGYYPNDQIASRYTVAASGEHTYAHHLLMEQSLKYLKSDGLALFLAPANLFTSPQAPLLKKWLSGYASLLAVITLPEKLFGNSQNAKSLYVLKKQSDSPIQTLVYPLASLTNPEDVRNFMEIVKKWQNDNAI
ncbi:class I SAM-dependent methyltransferase [Streptococcus plurextorum]|uniref:class I SAM-dependent methyltransferase n=1 Tax=Streptococcus plurextorum TaxID=456876 RepID=UPI0004116EB8|nr:class I SAM-dependent methyltransferase [Streptococcus plurextorum]